MEHQNEAQPEGEQDDFNLESEDLPKIKTAGDPSSFGNHNNSSDF
jgi:hypothetical protein